MPPPLHRKTILTDKTFYGVLFFALLGTRTPNDGGNDDNVIADILENGRDGCIVFAVEPTHAVIWRDGRRRVRRKRGGVEFPRTDFL